MISGILHIGLSVKNLEQSVDFYTRLLGMKLVNKASFGSQSMDAITGLTAAKGYGAMLEFKGGRLELFEFNQPSPKSFDGLRPVCDHGLSHFCLQVENIDKVYTALKSADVFVQSEPITFGDMKAFYARDPDGNVFELLAL